MEIFNRLWIEIYIDNFECWLKIEDYLTATNLGNSIFWTEFEEKSAKKNIKRRHIDGIFFQKDNSTIFGSIFNS